MLSEAEDTRVKQCLCLIARAKERPFMTSDDEKTINRLLKTPSAWRSYTELEAATVQTVF